MGGALAGGRVARRRTARLAASFGGPRHGGRSADEAARVDEALGTTPAGQPGHWPARGLDALRGVPESQWSLVLPTLKLSTQHGYKNVLAKHVLPYYWREWRLRDMV